jgi:hypothetical protein
VKIWSCAIIGATSSIAKPNISTQGNHNLVASPSFRASSNLTSFYQRVQWTQFYFVK